MVSDRFLPIEYMSFKYLRDGQPFPVPSNDGGLALTDKRMIIYKWWFESQVNQYPEVITYSLSPEGVAIRGIKATDISTLLDLPCIRKQIDEKIILINKFTETGPDVEEMYDNLKTAISKLIKNLQTLSEIVEQGIKTTRKAISSIKNGKIPVSLLEKMNEIDKRISSESSRIIAGFLIQPIIQGLLHTSTQDKSPAEVLDCTKRLYTELKDSCDYHYDALLRATRLL